jgi:hypothetical protein
MFADRADGIALAKLLSAQVRHSVLQATKPSAAQWARAFIAFGLAQPGPSLQSMMMAREASNEA